MSENSGLWVPAKPGDKGIFMVSRHIYEAWNQLAPDEKNLKGLQVYNKENPHINMELSKEFEQLIRTESEKEERAQSETSALSQPLEEIIIFCLQLLY